MIKIPTLLAGIAFQTRLVFRYRPSHRSVLEGSSCGGTEGDDYGKYISGLTMACLAILPLTASEHRGVVKFWKPVPG